MARPREDRIPGQPCLHCGHSAGAEGTERAAWVGYRSISYDCPVGAATIGWGPTGLIELYQLLVLIITAIGQAWDQVEGCRRAGGRFADRP
jgi:hypothetical protein